MTGARLVSTALLRVLLASFGAMASFYLLLAVVPLYATSVGAGATGAGFSTGVLMLTTVAAEIVSPWVLGRFGYRWVLAGGLVLLGAPALLLDVATGLGGILAISAVRGVGLAFTVVAGGALVAELVDPRRRGEGLGLHGVFVGVPAVLALPLGVWLAGRVGYPAVFVAAALAALVAVPLVPGLPVEDSRRREAMGIVAGLRSPALLRPSIVFAATTMATGVVVTFVPLAVGPPGAGAELAAVALFVQAATATVARWWAGRVGDRRGTGGLLIAGVLFTALGMFALVGGGPVIVVVGMAVFGIGFGLAQAASLTAMFARVTPAGYGAVSGVWNLAYDAGLGLGAAGFGVLAVWTGDRVAFAVTAALVLAATAVAWQDARRTAGAVPAGQD